MLHLLSILVRKDMLRSWRSPIATGAMIAFPFMMALMIGSVSSGGGGSGFPRVSLMVWDKDESILSQQLFGMLSSDQFSEYVETIVVEEDGIARMDEGEASAMLIIPEGFGDNLLEGNDVQLELIKNPAESIKPEIVEQGGEILVTYLDISAKVLGEELDDVFILFDQEEFPGADEIIRVATLLIERISSVERFIFPPVLQIETIKEANADGSDAGDGLNVYGIVLIMVSVMSLLFVASRTVLGFFEEEKSGMIRRQLVAPMSIRQIVMGRITFTVMLAILVEIILLGAGMLLGWIDASGGLLGAVLVMTSYSLAAAGLMCIIYGVARTEKQAALLSFIFVMGMSVLGGSMSPVDVFPEGLQRISRLTLNYWAIEGLLDQLVFMKPLADIAKHVTILLVFGVVSIGIGASLAQRKLRSGVS